jgi:hypothetical protein
MDRTPCNNACATAGECRNPSRMYVADHNWPAKRRASRRRMRLSICFIMAGNSASVTALIGANGNVPNPPANNWSGLGG